MTATSTHDLDDETYENLTQAFRVAIERGHRELLETLRMSLDDLGLDNDKILDQWLGEIIVEEAEDGITASSWYDEVEIETENFEATYTVYQDDCGWFPNEEATFVHKEVDLEVEVDGFPSRQVQNELFDVCEEKMKPTPSRPTTGLSYAERDPHLSGERF